MLSTQLYEREDTMRARLKIRGRENIKHYLTRELGMRVTRLTRKKVEYGKPDITITLTIDKENNVNVAVTSRPLAFAGVTSKSQEDCHKNKTGVLVAEVKDVILATILDYQDMTVLKASLQMG
jgi:tRNA U54 and U55 pseudouridine synthase Pus10